MIIRKTRTITITFIASAGLAFAAVAPAVSQAEPPTGPSQEQAERCEHYEFGYGYYVRGGMVALAHGWFIVANENFELAAEEKQKAEAEGCDTSTWTAVAAPPTKPTSPIHVPVRVSAPLPIAGA
jgi:hypothetical protein